MHQKVSKRGHIDLRTEYCAQFQPADDHLARIVTEVLEGAAHCVHDVVVEPLHFIPVFASPETRGQVHFIKYAPVETQAGLPVTVNHMRGQVINYLVMFDIIFRTVPVSAVNGKVAQRGTDIDLDAAAELALMDIPFFVEPAPVVMGCAGGLKLAQIDRKSTRLNSSHLG